MDEKVPCNECGKSISVDQATRRNGLCLFCSIKLEEKVACVECGKPVSARLASKRNGLCMRCRAKHNPFFVLYSSLVNQVCNEAAGFESLNDAQKLYYALMLFQNEVNNGGFHQFFFNSSGAYYNLIETALVSFDEPQVFELLHQAKQIVFPGIDVPADKETRRNLMPHVEPGSSRPEWANRLDELDRRFYSVPDTLTPKLKLFAREHGLVAEEPVSDQ